MLMQLCIIDASMQELTASGAEIPKPTATDLSVTSCNFLMRPSTLDSIEARDPVTPAHQTRPDHIAFIGNPGLCGIKQPVYYES